MGLDIVAYKKLGEYLGEEEPEHISGEYEYFCVNEDFPKQADNIQEGWYQVPGGEVGFCVGGYSTYNIFRNDIIRCLYNISDKEYWDSDKFNDLPLRDWLHFSDCEGVIGPETCSKIYSEILVVDKKIRAEFKDIRRFIELWNNFTKAFKLAASTGCVNFC